MLVDSTSRGASTAVSGGRVPAAGEVSLFQYIVGDGHQPNSGGFISSKKPIIRISYQGWDDHPHYKLLRPWHIILTIL